MTGKRFQYNVNKNTIEQDGKFVAYVNSVDGVRIANKLNVFQKENEQLKQQLSEQGTQIDFLKDENHHMKHVLNENKQLKQRNTNQYQQLNQLWQLIEAKDWETLTAMNNQMKEDEERLQREWKCYL